MVLEIIFSENEIWINAGFFPVLGFWDVTKKLQRLATEGPYCSNVIPVDWWEQAVCQAVRDCYFCYLITYLTLTLFLCQ
jgi:hypothetical protein